MPENIKQSISGRKRRNIISISIVLAGFLACSFFANAATTSATLAQTQTQAKLSYYLVDVIWNSANNTLALKSGTNISLTTAKLTNDTGTGSQFYAMLLNNKGQYAVDKNKQTWKYYLGKWELPSGGRQGEIKFTVPYLATGTALYIMDAKSDKVALKENITQLSRPVPVAATTQKAAPIPAQAKLQTYQLAGHSAAYWWMMRGIIILVLGGIGYFVYWFRKKRKAAGTINIMNIPQKR